MSDNHNRNQTPANRRSFLKKAAAGAAAAAGGAALLAGKPAAANHVPFFDPDNNDPNAAINQATEGDIAILRFLAAAELIEDDLWDQYCELARNQPAYRDALINIDPSLVRYVCDVRDDERSHHQLINSYLSLIGEAPVSLDPFRTIPSSKATGSSQRLRITNLRSLTIDTSWYFRYRRPGNPDLGRTYGQVVNIDNRPTIPYGNNLTRIEAQAIAHTAAFHFNFIEQGGSSLYLSLLRRATGLNILKIMASIYAVEAYQFAAFHKSLENIFGLSYQGLTFPNLVNQPDLAQAIMPEPSDFLLRNLPRTSVIHPMETRNAGAVAIATALVQQGLFEGQRPAFFRAVTDLATAADQAFRQCVPPQID